MRTSPLIKRWFLSVIFVGAFSIALIGCDQISSFFNKNKASAAPAASPAGTAAVAAPAVSTTPAAAPSIDNPNAPLAPDVLAKVGNWTLTLPDFNQRLKYLKELIPDFNGDDLATKKAILEELVRQQLLVMGAEQAGLGNKKEITDAVEEFRRSLLVQEAAVKLTEGVKATDPEAQEFYDQNKAAFAEVTEYHLREIVMSTQDGAKEVLVELLKGADFAEMAKNRSKSKTAEKGGDLGFVGTFEVPQMESVVQSLGTGDVSSVFKGSGGDYYIVKLEEKREGKQQEFTEVKADILAFLTQRKQLEAIQKHIDELRQKTVVKTNEALLQRK